MIGFDLGNRCQCSKTFGRHCRDINLCVSAGALHVYIYPSRNWYQVNHVEHNFQEIFFEKTKSSICVFQVTFVPRHEAKNYQNFERKWTTAKHFL